VTAWPARFRTALRRRWIRWRIRGAIRKLAKDIEADFAKQESDVDLWREWLKHQPSKNETPSD
jgi:hypothetical protein